MAEGLRVVVAQAEIAEGLQVAVAAVGLREGPSGLQAATVTEAGVEVTVLGV